VKYLMLFMLSFVSCTKQINNKDVMQETAIEEIVDCGYAPGEHACDFTLFNHKNQNISLYDYKGKVILLDFSTMWCYYCGAAAMKEVELVNMYKDSGFEWVTILVENDSGKQPSCNDLKSWVNEFNLESPVLSGKKDSLLDFENDNIDVGYLSVGFPTFVIIDKEMNIVEYIHGWSYDGIKMKIEEAVQ
jgi:peroxiredoxin